MNRLYGWRGLGLIARVTLIAEFVPRILGYFAQLIHVNATVLVVIVIGALWSVNSAKAKATEIRVGNIVAAQGVTNTNVTNVNTRVNGLSGAATGTGQPPGVPTGGPNGTGFFNTGAQTAGTAHIHPLPNFPTASHTHDFDGHTHNLPSV